MRRFAVVVVIIFIACSVVQASSTPMEIVKNYIDQVINTLTNKELKITEKKKELKTF